ncbi:hypothetical protein QTP88_002296 [Uroleucon formosanum]
MMKDLYRKTRLLILDVYAALRAGGLDEESTLRSRQPPRPPHGAKKRRNAAESDSYTQFIGLPCNGVYAFNLANHPLYVYQKGAMEMYTQGNKDAKYIIWSDLFGQYLEINCCTSLSHDRTNDHSPSLTTRTVILDFCHDFSKKNVDKRR